MINKKSSPGLYIAATEQQAQLLPYDLYDMGALAVETRDSTTMNLPDNTDKVLLIAGFENSEQRDSARQILAREYSPLDIISKDITDDGWSEGWKQFFKPVVLNTLQVITPWMEPPDKNLKTLVIDPGQAFGTGGHATTKLILQFLENRHLSGSLPSRILDVGCGSGILSIACAMMGATDITGIDIDEVCENAVAKNAAANSVDGFITAKTAVPSDITGRWPLVLANIQLAVFLKTASSIAPLVETGGELLISGILKDQKQQCIELFSEFTVEQSSELEGWLALALRKKRQ